MRAALESFDVDAEKREIYFFDTPELGLFEAGVVLPARLVRDGADDSTVKLRPVALEQLSDYWTRTEGFDVELGAPGEDAIWSAKLSVDQNRGEIREVAAGERSIHKLFSEEQEKLVQEHGPGGITWDDLTVFGPIDVRKREVEPKGFDYEVTVEEWVLPDDSDLIELSVKAEAGDAAKASEAFLELLRSRGIDTEGDQQTKTRAALRYFTTGVGIAEDTRRGGEGGIQMIGALLLGLVAGAVGRMLTPRDLFRHMSEPASWGVSILLGVVGALLGYLIFTLGLGLGDDDIFDWGGIVGAIIGVVITISIVGWFVRRRQARSRIAGYVPPPR